MSMINILVATDNHLGYYEKDILRGQDSFKSFEEILYYANKEDVDFILLAGDIYHDSRPSTTTLEESIRLLRKYCYGNKPVEFTILSDPVQNYANSSFLHSNFTDPNINVMIPVFAIHGNHDDPSGPGGKCAVDLLHSSGLVNLFGKFSSVEHLNVSPMLIKKGDTKLALYGIGAHREERLHRLFKNNAVTFQRPANDPDSWFSILLVHQNRIKHGETNYLPEHFIPEFFDLIIWGHEHECRLQPEWNPNRNFYISQPGSSVATSLSAGEAVTKACGLLQVQGTEFKVNDTV